MQEIGDGTRWFYQQCLVFISTGSNLSAIVLSKVDHCSLSLAVSPRYERQKSETKHQLAQKATRVGCVLKQWLFLPLSLKTHENIAMGNRSGRGCTHRRRRIFFCVSGVYRSGTYNNLGLFVCFVLFSTKTSKLQLCILSSRAIFQGSVSLHNSTDPRRIFGRWPLDYYEVFGLRSTTWPNLNRPTVVCNLIWQPPPPTYPPTHPGAHRKSVECCCSKIPMAFA